MQEVVNISDDDNVEVQHQQQQPIVEVEKKGNHPERPALE